MSVRSNIQVVLKGLEVLVTLNQKNGLTVAELSRALNIPRSTVFRLLKTLIAEGYIQLDAGRCYRLTKKVRGLCDKIQPEAWIKQAVPDAIQVLHEKFRWPVAICSLRGDRILLDYVTDRQCPQLITRRMVGYQITFLDMAAGRVVLSSLPPDIQTPLLRKIVQLEAKNFSEIFGSTKALREALHRIKKLGYDENVSKGFRVLAVPLLITNVFAALSVRIPYVEGGGGFDRQAVIDALRAAVQSIKTLALTQDASSDANLRLPSAARRMAIS